MEPRRNEARAIARSRFSSLGSFIFDVDDTADRGREILSVAIDLSQRIVSPRLGVHKHAVDALDRVKILLQRLRHHVIQIQSRSVQYLGDFRAGASVASPLRFCASTRREEGS
jgi:hypothetical protein